MTPLAEIQQLREELHDHNFRYYSLNEPTISDAEFDPKLRRLTELETQWPDYGDPNSPTKRVGNAPITGFAKCKHKVRMLSLDNAFKPEEVVKFFQKQGVQGDAIMVATPKVDGVASSLHYEDGQFTLALTRGDGTTGDDITQNVRCIGAVPLVARMRATGEVRGEVYMPLAEFKRVNDELAAAGEDLFANPRNAAAGTLKQRDSSQVAARGLCFVAYRYIPSGTAPWERVIFSADCDGVNCPVCQTDFADCPCPGPTQDGYDYEERADGLWARKQGVQGIMSTMDELDMLKRLGMPTVVHTNDRVAVASELIDDFAYYRAQLPYATDGVVLRLEDGRLADSLGEGSKYVNWAVAYKFPEEEVATKLLSVTCQVGKTGTITPVAELHPVTVAGTVVKRASLMNQDEVDRIGVAVGDIVAVIKSGEIIPRVVRTIRSDDHEAYYAQWPDVPKEKWTPIADFNRDAGRVWKMPEVCPCCQTKLVRATNATGKAAVAFICPNRDGCTEQVVQRLQHACGKGALDWDGMGDAQVRALVTNGFTRLSHLFDPGRNPEACLSAAAAKKFAKQKEVVKGQPLWRKLNALGIDGIGTTLSKELEIKYKDIVAIAMAPRAEIVALLGEVNTASLVEYLAANIEELDALDQFGVKLESQRKEGVLSGKSFVITGELQTGTRSAISDLIENAGGVVKGSVSKRVTYLVVGDNAGATKSAGAAKIGVRCISEAELYRLLGIEMPAPAFLLDE